MSGAVVPVCVGKANCDNCDGNRMQNLATQILEWSSGRSEAVCLANLAVG